jgi:hypothetical protein
LRHSAISDVGRRVPSGWKSRVGMFHSYLLQPEGRKILGQPGSGGEHLPAGYREGWR